ncbi:MAG: MHS family MFS transporter [Rubrobacteraceae bacterium]|nr:MHS family MFS transporter [Rubrobacteraceae bacterium]
MNDTQVGNNVREQRSSIVRVIVASSIGTIIEWYDFYLFGTVAALGFLTPLFFPGFNPLAGTLAVFGSYAVAFIGRPIGGFVIGNLGDKIGRKKTLLITVVLMGAGTFLIGLLPTYAIIGLAAPILLVILRLIQGFSAGGEWGGAALMTVEHAPPNRRAFYSSFVQIGVGGGFIIGNGVLLAVSYALSNKQLAAWGWRIPFLLSVVLVLIGFYIRSRISETPVFVEEVERKRREARVPLFEVIHKYPREVLCATGANLATSAQGTVLAVYAVAYAVGQAGASPDFMLSLVIGTELLGIFTTIGVGWWADNGGGKKRLALASFLFQIVWAIPFFKLIDTGSSLLIAIALIVLPLLALWAYPVLAALLGELFPPEVRQSGMSIGYQLGGILGAGFAPAILSAIYGTTHDSAFLSLYVIVIALIGFVSIVTMKTRP